MSTRPSRRHLQLIVTAFVVTIAVLSANHSTADAAASEPTAGSAESTESTGPDLEAGSWIGMPGQGAWSDYSVSATFTIGSEAASVYLRARNGDPGNSYMWQVNITGAQPILKKHVWSGGGVRSVTETPIQQVITPGTEHSAHTLRVAATGQTITTWIDGVQVDTATDSTYGTGTIGFRESATERATYRDVVVTNAGGQTLFADPLAGSSTNPFSAGTLGSDGLVVTNASAMLNPLNQTPRLRHEFNAGTRIATATLYASALGIYQLSLNGKPVGNELFAPGWTNYVHQIQYQTHDVTDLLRSGDNALAAQLAPGWYSGNVGWFGPSQYGETPALWAQLRLTYTDGSTRLISTDASWKASTAGPVRSADNYLGETYDARHEQSGWDRPGYRETGWTGVEVLPSESGKLVPQIGPPVRVTDQLKPVAITEPTPGTYVYDLGQEIAGVVRLKATGPAGTTITLRHAQALKPDGTLYTDNLAAGPEPYRYADQTDRFTLRGDGTEKFQPTFTYHGFRYVSVTGYPGTPKLADLTGIVEGTDAPVTGSFSTSSPMLNQLQSNIAWSERSNLFSIPTDTDARTERLGWTGDANFFAPTAVFNRDLAGFYAKWQRDLIDSQTADGIFDNVAPTWPAVANAGYGGGWGDAGVVIPYVVWQQYGELGIVRDSYPAMRKYLAAMESQSTGLILPSSFAPAADWMNVGQPTPGDLIATAYFAYDASLLAQMAAATDHDADAAYYRDLFGRIAAAWTARYVATDGSIAGNSQTAYVLALHLGVLPEARRGQAADRLVGLVEAAGTHLTTGFVGTQWLLPVLSATGHTDVAYALIQQTSYPSWGYEIAHGATTIWERWDAIGADGNFNPNTNGNSLNHSVDGAVGIWMYQTITGIVADPEHPGYQHFFLGPRPGGGLANARATLQTSHGLITSSWRVTAKGTVFDFDVPPGTTATIDVPGRAATVVGAGHHQITTTREDGTTR